MPTSPRRALLVVDVQNEYFMSNLPIEYPPPEGSIVKIARAIDAARAAKVPVVVVQHTAPEGSPVFDKGTRGWALHPEVERRGHDYIFEKKLASSFTGTGLADWLAAHDIDTLTVVGYMTHNCVASTTFEAAHRGLKVEVLSDATGSLPYKNGAGSASAEEIHRAFLVVFQSNFAAVLDTEAWASALVTGREPERDNLVASNRRARG